ncbi:MAG: alkaline phosphatase D family protein [Saprospiraceae bacterium]|nr:alkaline phosphatase D family protein [Saprospiraceae bacterium]
MRNTTIVTLLWLVVLFTACESSSPSLFLGQGLMAGEITAESVILQARLTASDTLMAGDVPGKAGFGYFEIAQSDDFENALQSELIEALPSYDFILKQKIADLEPNTPYFYRLIFGETSEPDQQSEVASFKTLPGRDKADKVSFVVVTGMNYYHFHFGKYDSTKAYKGPDKALGYPALATMKELGPDYFIGTGDNVYFDHPTERDFTKAVEAGKSPHPGRYDGKEVKDETGMRRKYHEQFVQPRFRELFQSVGTYWEKDDHDYRFNDADPYQDLAISHELGIKNFKEQVPITDPKDAKAKTYRTHRMNRDLQVWFLEGRDYRSANSMPDGPEKTLLGIEQLQWLKQTLLASNATFKIIISPTPMVGPDDAYKSDNHVNPKGFHHEGEALFQWFVDNDFLEKNLYLVCGDRHWQYHAKHPSGVEEFSTGALVDNNSRAGRLAGDPNSTDPDSLIQQYYIQGTKESASGGFLWVDVKREGETPKATFRFYDEKGAVQYEVVK